MTPPRPRSAAAAARREDDPDPRRSRRVRWVVACVAAAVVAAGAVVACVLLLPSGRDEPGSRYPSVSVAPAVATSPRPGTLSPSDFGAIGDGQHDDGPALQSALDAAGGRTVALSGGATYLSRQALLLPSHTTLEGPRSAVLAFTWVDTDQSDSGGAFYIGNRDQNDGNDDIVLTGFSIRGAGTGLPRGPNLTGQSLNVPALRLRHVNTFRIRDLDVSDAPAISILYQGCIHGQLEENDVHDSGRDGITGTALGSALADITVADNTIERIGDDGIAIAGATANAPNSTVLPTDIKILRNRIIGWPSDPNGLIIGRGIALIAVTDVQVRGNTIQRTSGPGILVTGAPSPQSVNPLDGQPWYTDRVVVSDNTVQDAGFFQATSVLSPDDTAGRTDGNGIEISRARSVVVQGNTADSVAGDDVTSSECVDCRIQSS